MGTLYGDQARMAITLITGIRPTSPPARRRSLPRHTSLAGLGAGLFGFATPPPASLHATACIAAINGMADGDIVQDVGGAVWLYDSRAIAEPGDNVVVPTSGRGRWVRRGRR